MARLGGTPVPAYLLGHPADAENGAREQALAVGEIVRTAARLKSAGTKGC
ncbi:hypothetical protein [Streptomyces sp. DSM 40907]|nr:hypothetical protein [Streptomyces sp. DSM 40907]